mgnify:CR=1 FL=1
MSALEKIFAAIVKESAINLSDLFDKSFETKSFNGKQWKNRINNRRGSLLVDSGALRRSLKYTITGNTIVWTSNLPYAQIHNEGGKIKITPKMHRFFWAKYMSLSKKVKKGKKGQVLKASKTNYEEAQLYKALALKKIGTFITIPQRQFIGESPEVKIRVDKIANKYINKLIETFFKIKS